MMPDIPSRPQAPPSEEQRLQALNDLWVLDSEAAPLFDELAQAASLVCGMPVALISLLDDRREWIKAKVGLDGVDL